ncbi:unnamed protein product [Clonostachys rhizophaga]|uniref:Oligopeptide transporter n=1 Tax=Clonostachys rhizophaga TaxID=160324 RepID=A0A9N9YKP9_9HYPO|nr:unnamed protein product [Clonostachys rhizophaga]
MEEPSCTARSLLAGLFIGTLISLSNTYYGLQIGAASQMSMVSGLLGFAGFKACSKYLREPFTPAENILVISIATACGCMPVMAGLIGVVPALEFLINEEENGPMVLPLGTIFVWSVALSLFGLIFASLFRQYFIVREKLPWPGARATANLIATLHNEGKPMRSPALTAVQTAQDDQTLRSSSPDSNSLEPETAWTEKLRALSQGAGAAGIISIVIYFIPILRQLPVFGNNAATSWLWSVDLSPGFFGQGIITGPVITLHMLLGAIVGWGILSPYARNQGWAPGDVDDWSTGSRGWIIWVSLAALLADASIKMSWLLLSPILKRRVIIQTYLQSIWKSDSGDQPLLRPSRTQYMTVEHNYPDEFSAQDGMADQRPTPGNQSTFRNDSSRMHFRNHHDHWRALTAAFISILVCTAAVQLLFGSIMPWTFTVIAIFLSLPMAAVGIRALAETDCNPESALVSQWIFTLLAPASNPNALILNLLSAAIAQAGANQAGALSYDFKVGHLVGSRLDVQIPGQIVGSLFGTLVSGGIYKLYTSQYPIPGPLFRVPASFVVLSTARLLLGRGLPDGVGPFVVGAAVLSAVATMVKMRYHDRWWQHLVPSGVAFAIGIYNTPSFTITRAVGGLVYLWYKQRHQGEGSIILLASGLLLGESIASLITLGMGALGVPHFGT